MGGIDARHATAAGVAAPAATEVEPRRGVVAPNGLEPTAAGLAGHRHQLTVANRVVVPILARCTTDATHVHHLAI